MKITKYTEAEQVPFNLEARKMCIRKDLEVVRLTLKAGDTLPLHTNPFDVVIFITNGSGIFHSDAGDVSVEPETAIEVEKNSNRGISNTGQSEMKLLIIKLL